MLVAERPGRGHMPGPSELNFHIAIINHLRVRGRAGIVFWHTPNGEARDSRTGAKLKAMGTVPGMPDIMLLIDGRLHCLEVKAESGRLSQTQRLTQHALGAAGAICATAWDVDGALKILSAWGALK